MRHWADVARGKRHLPSIGLGKVRQERFASLAGGAKEATLVTRSRRCAGGTLLLNAAVRPGGEIRVEVQDAAGSPLDGHALTDCTPIRDAGVRLPVQWGAIVGNPAWAERDINLRITLRDAEQFAFQSAGA